MGFKDIFRPRLESSNPKARWKAVKKISDQTLLADIAKNDKEMYVRDTAVAKITNQALLAEIAKNDKENQVRCSAVKNPNFINKIELADLAINGYDHRVCLYAVDKLTDQAALEDVAKNSQDILVRLAAVEKLNLTNQTLLEDIAKNGKNEFLCSAAVEKLTDQALLIDIAKKSGEGLVRISAVENPHFTDQSALFEIAIHSPNWSVGKAVIDKLTDKALLDELSKNNLNDNVCEAAKMRLAYLKLNK